jgi:predicted RNA-binding Zn ribbon-like protein
MPAPSPRPFDLDGHALCLDFLNTLAERAHQRGERLHTYAELVRFAREAGTLTSGEAESLAAGAALDPRRARRALRAAIALRELLHRLLIADPASPDAHDLARLNHALGRALAHRRLQASGGRYDWAWESPPGALERPLWPILLSAAELFASGQSDRVRSCASPTCGWMFLDRSRAGRRRWCDMKACGNRAKARRHYHRHRPAARS